MHNTIVLSIINAYQRVFSPGRGVVGRAVFGGASCRFFPSCSQYTHEAVRQHGIITGLLLGLWRLARCAPWSAGGHDPVPKTIKH